MPRGSVGQCNFGDHRPSMAGLSRRHRLAEHRLWINERAIDGIESLKMFVARIAALIV